MGDLSNWLYNIATQVPALVKLLVAIAYVSGLGFLAVGIAKFKKCSQGAMAAQTFGVGDPLIHVMVGAALLYFGGFIQSGSVTFFGTGSALAYQTNLGGSGLFGSFIAPIILLIRLVGYMAFLKGLYMLAKVGGGHSQQGGAAKAAVHLLGGILAINIEATYVVLVNTLGGTNLNSIS